MAVNWGKGQGKGDTDVNKGKGKGKNMAGKGKGKGYGVAGGLIDRPPGCPSRLPTKRARDLSPAAQRVPGRRCCCHQTRCQSRLRCQSRPGAL